MGHRATYVRKKATSHCINPDVFTLLFSYKACVCVEEDWVCDKHFIQDDGGECIRADGKEIDMTPPKVCNSMYTVNLGYR